MNLTDHFTLEEFVRSETADKLGIDNTPDLETITRLTITAQHLEEVRVALHGLPITISSGYRCPALNKAVGGVFYSAHTQGWAADILCPAFGTPHDVIKQIIAYGIKFDQCIIESSHDVSWVHISFAPTMRQQIMTASGEAGAMAYTSGIA